MRYQGTLWEGSVFLDLSREVRFIAACPPQPPTQATPHNQRTRRRVPRRAARASVPSARARASSCRSAGTADGSAGSVGVARRSGAGRLASPATEATWEVLRFLFLCVCVFGLGSRFELLCFLGCFRWNTVLRVAFNGKPKGNLGFGRGEGIGRGASGHLPKC